MWLHVFLKSLGDLAVLSYLNLGINVTLCGAVIAQTLRHPPATSPQRDIVVPDALSVGGAFASFGFAYGCHPVLPDVLSSMRRPREFGRMIKEHPARQPSPRALALHNTRPRQPICRLPLSWPSPCTCPS